MNDRNTVLLADKFASLNELSCISADLVIDPVAGFFNCGSSAVHKRDTHSDRTDIQMLAVEHLHRLDYFMFVNHKSLTFKGRSDGVHCVEKSGVLDRDLYAELLT